MIEYREGNLLEADAEALVNTVNTEGVSGKGVALMFKETFPENYRAYARACAEGQLKPGGLFITERQQLVGPRWIVNFATKKEWWKPSQYEWIETGLARLRQEIAARGIGSIALPPLGTGNGRLDWHRVKSLIEQALGDLDCRVIIYKPTTTYQNVVKRRGVEKLTPARALIAEAIRRYEILGFECSMLEAQKLAYFLSAASKRMGVPDPIGADFVAHRYGPYSDAVRHLLDSLDGSYLLCSRRVADARPTDPIRFRYDRRQRIAAYLTSPEAQPYRPALDHVARKIDGFESPHGLELLATVDWLRREQGVAMEGEAMRKAIATWPGPLRAAARKSRIFTPDHIQAAIDHLLRVEPN